MTNIEIEGENLVLHVEGADELFALKSHLTIPLKHIDRAEFDPDLAHQWIKGLKLVGARIPGVIKAGTFFQDGGRVFWDVHHPDQTVVINLKDETYKKLIVEVINPQQTVALINQALNK
jgi:hypothetical protein